MNKDKNLLFGILAIQMGYITQVQLIESTEIWTKNQDRHLEDILLEKGFISTQQSDEIAKLISIRLEKSGGDTQEVLESLGGTDAVSKSFGGSIILTESGEVLPSIGGSQEPTDTVSAQDDLTNDERLTVEQPGRYTIMGEQGRGGIGKVLVAFDSHLGREIAVKELIAFDEDVNKDHPTPISKTAAMVARFLTEARITGQLEHPSIVPVYEIGRKPDGSIYYTMKLVKGKNLHDQLKGERDYEGRIKYLQNFIDLCNAIGYANSRGVIHRDIKPQNVMIGEFGETVVLDWGLAKVKGKLEEKNSRFKKEVEKFKNIISNKTLEGGILGTPIYMPPEQAEGMINEIDEKSDIYSLGAVLFEILTGYPPFSGETVYEIISKVINGDLEEIKEEKIPPELISICMKAMNKEKKERYNSALELAEDISKFISGSLVSAYSYNPWERLKKIVKRNKSVVITGFLGVLGIIAISVIYGFYITDQKAKSQALLSESLYIQGKNQESEKDFNNACESFSKSLILNKDHSKEDLIRFDLLRNISSIIPVKDRFKYSFNNKVKFSRETETAVQLSGEKNLVFYNFRDRMISKEFPAKDIINFFFDNTGENLIITDKNMLTHIINIETEERRTCFENSNHFNTISNDGKMICSYDEWGCFVYDIDSRKILGERDYLREDVTGMFRLKFSDFSRDGRFLVNVSISSLGLVRIYSIPGLKEVVEIPISSRISGIHITESNRLVCSDVSGNITVIPLDGVFKDVNKINVSKTGIRSFAVDNKDKVIVTLNSDNTMDVIDFEKLTKKAKVILPNEFNFISFNKDSSTLYLGNGEEITEYNSESIRSNYRIDYEEGFYDITVSQNKKNFVISYKDKIDIYDHTDFSLVNSIPLPSNGMRTFDINDEKDILVLTKENKIEIGKILNFNTEKRVIENDRPIYRIEINHQCKFLLTLDMESKLVLWNIETGKEHARYRDFSTTPMPSPCFTPNGKYFIYVSSNTKKEIRIVDVRNLTEVLSLESRYYKFNLEGEILFNLDLDKNFTLYDLDPLKTKQKLENLDKGVFPVPVDITPDGKYLILQAIQEGVVSDTTTYIPKDKDFIIIYNLQEGKEIQRILCDYDVFQDLSFYENKVILRFSKRTKFENSVLKDNVLIFFNLSTLKVEGNFYMPQIQYFKFNNDFEDPVFFILKNNVISVIPIYLLFLDKYMLRKKVHE